jgi:adenylate kinase family enzyme
MTQKLIVLRGPSGSGKSTVARALFDKTKRKTCLIEQDYYRFIFTPYKNGSKEHSATIHTMIKENVLTALRDGYDVILEGILSTKSYSNVFEEMLKEHPTENYLFYFDVGLEETIRRHRTRPPRNTPTYTEDDMRSFYSGTYESIHDDEKVIPETSSLDETLNFVIESSDF